MTAPIRRYPIGVQDFEKLITSGYTYVDKTELMYKLIQGGEAAFLSRPRRFGKSLLVSTLKAYFEGKKELFKGLAIEQLEKEWVQHPVLHLSFATRKNSNGDRAFEEMLQSLLEDFEKTYHIKEIRTSLSGRFEKVIETAYLTTGKPVVVLIDEYDAPLLDNLYHEEKLQNARILLRDFFSPLKDCGKYMKFLFITGITKFSQLSIFSELNHLRNISMTPQFSAICGITEEELLTHFKEDIALLAESNSEKYDEACAHLKRRYDGYHLSEKSPDVYNPYSVLHVLLDNKYDNYWFASATPTFLLDLLQHQKINIDELEGAELKSSRFNAPITDTLDIIPTFYHSGYLTIKSYDKAMDIYTIGIPNEEVRIGLVESLIPRLLPNVFSDNNLSSFHFARDLMKGDINTFLTRLQVFFAKIPYDLNNKSEKHYQTIFYIFTVLIDQYVEVEKKTASGRIDMLIRTPEHLYLLEFKLNYTAQDALAQINQKGYDAPFQLDSQKVIKVGVNFDDTTRTIRDWVVE